MFDATTRADSECVGRVRKQQLEQSNGASSYVRTSQDALHGLQLANMIHVSLAHTLSPTTASQAGSAQRIACVTVSMCRLRVVTPASPETEQQIVTW